MLAGEKRGRFREAVKEQEDTSLELHEGAWRYRFYYYYKYHRVLSTRRREAAGGNKSHPTGRAKRAENKSHPTGGPPKKIRAGAYNQKAPVWALQPRRVGRVSFHYA